MKKPVPWKREHVQADSDHIFGAVVLIGVSYCTGTTFAGMYFHPYHLLLWVD
jgi:hypothetical protein